MATTKMICTVLCAYLLLLSQFSSAFVRPSSSNDLASIFVLRPTTTSTTAHFAWNNDNNNNNKDEAAIEEEARLKIITARRKQIRQTLKAAENLRNFRLARNMVPEIDPETGKPISDDGKTALSITAFVVAAGAIALRIGGRAALVSATGLNFLTESPEIKNNLDTVLNAADNMDIITKLVLFTGAWTGVKVLCFDAGGVVLALASGILFGGVLQGAIISAAAATFGSSVAFGMAKADTPVRKKALELLDEYPSLRGIDKVVAKDGLKAVLTLRLAPVLPIPIGMYNYIYGVTNVPILDFMGGIFIGSLKPYLLDSYLGYFGKEVIQGTTDEGGIQDILLLVALGFSVLIGVFASQLAAETWESVLEEVEEEKKRKGEIDDDVEDEKDDGVVREIFGITLPQWMVGFQLQMKAADVRINELILDEYEAKVWNYTIATENGGNLLFKNKKDVTKFLPAEKDPANYAGSPELTNANQGIDLSASVCDGLVLSPLLFGAFVKYADPLYDEMKDELLQNRPRRRLVIGGPQTEAKRQDLLQRLNQVKIQTKNRISMLDERINYDQ